MAYDESKLVRLKHLKEMGENAKRDLDALSTRVDALVEAGGQPNVLESIKVNGVAQAITNKAADIAVPTKVSQLSNDSKYQTQTEVESSIQTAISKTGHASFEKAESVPSAANATENVMYLVMNSETGHYDIYAKVGGEVVLLDDTTVDLSGYVTKESGKGLSTNDFTDAEKTKLEGIEEGANKYIHPTYTAAASGLYKITVDENGHVSAVTPVEKADITALGIPNGDNATTSKAGMMSAADKTKLDGMQIASDAEVTEMLNEVFKTSV